MNGQMIVYPVGFDPELDIPLVKHYDGDIPLEDLQGAVDGSIEIVPYWNSFAVNGETREAILFCNEEGKLKGFHRNIYMTALWDEVLTAKNMSRFNNAGVELDYLVGPIAVIIGDDEFMRNF